MNHDAARWNLSPEHLYQETWSRWVLREHGQLSQVSRACNVGIGQGEWDDWLGYALPPTAELTSLDIDGDVVLRFQERQQEEGHLYPSRAVHGDLFTTDEGPFDLVTATGSTLRETGDPVGAVAALMRLVAPGGLLYVVVPHASIDLEAVLAAFQGEVQTSCWDELPRAAITAVLARPS